MKLFLIVLLFTSVSLSHSLFKELTSKTESDSESEEFFDVEDSDSNEFFSFEELDAEPESLEVSFGPIECTCLEQGHEKSIISLANLIDSDDEEFCTGKIINHELILTTKHCVGKKTAKEIKVTTNLRDSNDEDIEKETYLAEIIFEKEYVDLAIIKVKNRMTFKTNQVEPACLNLRKNAVKEDNFVPVLTEKNIEFFNEIVGSRHC